MSNVSLFFLANHGNVVPKVEWQKISMRKAKRKLYEQDVVQKGLQKKTNL
jgi:hypothetical protein